MNDRDPGRENAPSAGDGHRPYIPIWFDDAGLSLSACRVLVHLWRRRNKNTGQCNPSVAAICKACNLHRETVWKALAELEGAGLLKRTKKFRTSNQYDLLCPIGRKNQPIKPADISGLLPEVQLAGNIAPIGRKNRQQEAGNSGHQGYSLKDIKEGESDSHSVFLGWIREVEAMQEFVNRDDIASIAAIIGEGKVRNAAHLAACARNERRPKFRKAVGSATPGIGEPEGWRTFAEKAYPEARLLDPTSDFYAKTWAQVPPEYQQKFSREMSNV